MGGWTAVLSSRRSRDFIFGRTVRCLVSLGWPARTDSGSQAPGTTIDCIRGSLTTFSFDDKGRCPTRVAWGYIRPPPLSNLQLRKLAIAASALKMGNARPETRPYGLLPPKKSERMGGGGCLTFVHDLFFLFGSSKSRRLLPHGSDVHM